MAIEGTINDQITDSISQAVTYVVGNSSAETKSMLDTLMAETVGMAMYNAVTNQHNAQMVSNASVIAACARMLKTPIATTPATPLFAPLIAGVTPATAPVNEAQVFQLMGSGFSATNLAIRIMDADGNLIATLSGSSQISGPVTATSITFSYTFATEGTYGLRVQNSDATKSNKVTVTVAVGDPVITAVIAAAQNVYSVRGKHLHPKLAAVLEDAEGKIINGISTTDLRSDGLTLAVPPGSGPGPYRLSITNPGRPAVWKLFQAAIPMTPVTTVYEPAEGQAGVSSAAQAMVKEEGTVRCPCQPPPCEQQS